MNGIELLQKLARLYSDTVKDWSQDSGLIDTDLS